jgi:hypothetical protein
VLKHVFLFDATRHIGLAQSLLGSAQTYTSQFQAEAVEWFVRPQQAQAFRASGADVHVVTASTAWPAIESRVKELRLTAPRTAIFMFFRTIQWSCELLRDSMILNSRSVHSA